MNALSFQLRLLEPVLVGQVNGGDPNSAIGLNYIPGSAIRGAIIRQFLAGRTERTVDAADEEFQVLFLAGDVRFLNAYPVSSTGQRTLPVPLSWRKEKGEDSRTVFNFVRGEGDDPDTLWEGVEEPFCTVWEDESNQTCAELVPRKTELKIHNARKNHQTIAKGTSTIFRYQALSAGQQLAGAILSSDRSILVDKIAPLLSSGDAPHISIGKSHTAGYGLVAIEDVKLDENWVEYPLINGGSGDIIVTLLSDAIIRDENTGASIPTIDPALGGATHINAFANPIICGGFNRTWNLPLPQEWGIQAGSVFVYKAKPALNQLLRQLGEEGIGERRVEGFGRIAVGWNTARVIDIPREGAPVPPLRPLPLQNVTLATQMLNRILRERLDELLIKGINSTSITSPPRKSQLSGIRAILRNALQTGKITLVSAHLTNMRGKTHQQFENARVKSNTLTGWLKAFADHPEIVWKKLNLGELPSIGELRPSLTPELAVEYAIRLIDSVIHNALKTWEACE